MVWNLLLIMFNSGTNIFEGIYHVGSVAHCSRSQDIDLFKFQLSYYYNPLQDSCPITSAVLRHAIRTHVPLIFLNRDKKSYRLSEKCATLCWCAILGQMLENLYPFQGRGMSCLFSSKQLQYIAGITHVKNWEKYLHIQPTSYFWVLWPFQMFTGSFEIHSVKQ